PLSLSSPLCPLSSARSPPLSPNVDLGCLSNEDPWGGTPQWPEKLLPQNPEKVNTRFFLYTSFKPSKRSMFVSHGFISDAVIKVEDVNCFCVDWHGGSYGTYPQAVNHIRVVGAVARFINTLDTCHYQLSKVHLVGHSLGAHAAGVAGKRRPGIARITGLDPPVGHVDFFPNGGEDMPGCSLVSKTTSFRILQIFYTSILTPDGFIGYPAASYESFQKVPFYALYKGNTLPGQSFYFNIGEKEPFAHT
uniref:Lipase domain-containing protein n=1 Tax=Leptobrachium leishanense TaxID=445787 RepID=A0A8C5QNZ2_9ANUR